MLQCRTCLGPLPFPWLSPCTPCLRTHDGEGPSWGGSELAQGRSAMSFAGHSYRVFKQWKISPTVRLNDWARALATGSTELEWMGTHADVIVPMPQSLQRSFELGHWPAGTLAGWITRDLGLPLKNLLKPHRSGSQARRSLPDRHTVEMNFEARTDPGSRHQRWLLVDDVRTTGATLEAAARALRRMGARGPISAWTLGFRPVLKRGPQGVQAPLRSHPIQTRSHRGPEHLWQA